MSFKPMLSATLEDTSVLKFPVLVSPKLDGVRALVLGDRIVSRTLKNIPNKATFAKYSLDALSGLDGELLAGSPTDSKAFVNTTSSVMTHDGEPTVTYYVFDDFSDQALPYEVRLANLKARVAGLNRPDIQVVEHEIVSTIEELSAYEEKTLSLGYEGVMIRSFDGKYKNGRATLKEGTLMKLKRFLDAEAEIIGFEELETNLNEQTKDERGYAKRSHQKAGKLGADTLGAFLVRGLNGEYANVEFSIGSGLDAETRKHIWENKDSWLGKIVNYKYFGHGVVDKPRHPVFKGIRAKEDIS